MNLDELETKARTALAVVQRETRRAAKAGRAVSDNVRAVRLHGGGLLTITIGPNVNAMAMPKRDRALLCSMLDAMDEYNEHESVAAFSDAAAGFFRAFSKWR